MDLRGRTALITGANGGIGQAIARALAGRGAKLVLTGRRADALEEIAREVDARAIVVDLADRAALDRLIEQTLEVDVLVANAAVPASGKVFRMEVAEIDEALDVNLRGPILLARSLGAAMAERGAGHLILVSSLSGKVVAPRSALYSATKFGMRGFAQGLRADLHGTGVGVSAIFPGFIRDAGMFAKSGAKLPSGVGTKTPEDVADAVVRAIERNLGEVDVAPLGLRLGSAFAGLAPELAAVASRWLGAARVADDIARGQRETKSRGG
jgi:short-subunit dehydrogenase